METSMDMKIPHVMVVEADPASNAHTTELIKRAGYRVTTVSDGFEALAAYHRETIDVVVTNLELPGLSGLRLLTVLKELDPGARVIVLSGCDRIEDAIEALREGRAFDFLRKPLAEPVQLLSAIERAMRWSVPRADNITSLPVHRHAPLPQALPDYVEPLTETELAIVKRLAAGCSNRQIADTLHFSEKTIRNYLSRVYDKLGVSSRLQAVAFCQQYGLVGYEGLEMELLAV